MNGAPDTIVGRVLKTRQLDRSIYGFDGHMIEEIRQRFIPEKVRLLLIGESPPAKGSFFYVKSNMTNFTAKAFEKTHGIAFRDHAEFLMYFKGLGCFLDDLSHKPVDDLPKDEREETLRCCVTPLSERIRTFDPPVIAIVLKKIEHYVREAVNKSGCTPEILVLPFAGNGHQTKYIEQLSKIVSEYLT